MAVNDRILEAERSLQDIAKELKRMRDAALLLEASQVKSDVVIASAIQLVEKVKQFAAICRNISPADTIARIDGLHTGIEQLAILLKASKSDTRGAIVDVELRVINIENQVQSLAKSSEVEQLSQIVGDSNNDTHAFIARVSSKVNALDDFAQNLASRSQRKQTIIMLLLAITLLGVLITIMLSIAPV